MKILALADIHGDLESLYTLIKKIKVDDRPDIILMAGDLTPFGPAELIDAIKEKLKEVSDYIFAVPGNEDPENVREKMKDFDIHGKKVKVKDVKIVGFEGAKWINSGKEVFISYDPIHEMLKKENEEQVIVLAHVPPFDTEVDKLWTGDHVGSPFLRSLIEEYQPDLVICGHIHEARGIDKIGKTTILNPGSLAEGYAAWIELKEKPEITFLKKGKKGWRKEKLVKAKR